MNPEKQRIAIAEACGWKVWQSKHGHWVWASPDRERFENEPVVARFSSETGEELPDQRPLGPECSAPVPDYLNDLNAMHESEKVLTDERQRERFHVLLRGTFEQTQISWFEYCHATAAQRAESFLRTIGKWEEGE